METIEAAKSLAALAQETRLVIFRALVQAGHSGLSVGKIREQLEIPSATLSFHLSALKNCGLAECQRQGRLLIYQANFNHMRELLVYLTEDCCAGNPEICAVSIKKNGKC